MPAGRRATTTIRGRSDPQPARCRQYTHDCLARRWWPGGKRTRRRGAALIVTTALVTFGGTITGLDTANATPDVVPEISLPDSAGLNTPTVPQPGPSGPSASSGSCAARPTTRVRARSGRCAPNEAPVRRLLTSSVVVLVALAGCTATDNTEPAPAGTGPVSLGDTSAVNCIPALRAGSYAMGFDTARNSGAESVTVKAVSLVGATNLAVADAYLMPLKSGGDDLVGVGLPWPLAPADQPAGWADKVEAVGADRLPPTAGLDTWNLVLHLVTPDPAQPAGYDHVSLAYAVGGRNYEAPAANRVEVRSTC